MNSNSKYWPDSVPTTLWQYDALRPAAQRDFPFVGIVVTPEFIAAFLFGVVLICIFAWRRFSEPSYDVKAGPYQDFKELKIWNLKDSESLRRAYVIYCICLVFIYAMLSFFGNVIVHLASQINVSGLQVSVGTVEFSSWQWPLMLAVGIAGFAPLINPLIPAEQILRRFAQAAVGIPTRLQEKATRIKTLIEGNPNNDARVKATHPAWSSQPMAAKLSGYLELRDNLRTVVAWSRKEHAEWSDPEIRRKLNEFERKVRDEAQDALDEFDELVLASSKKTMNAPGPPPGEESQKRLLNACLALDRARDQFAIIMAIYADYGSRFDSLEKGALKDAIVERFPVADDIPATGMPLYGFAVIFAIYYVFVWVLWHPAIAHVPLSAPNLAITAGAETLKVFLLIWLPATVIATFTDVAYGPRPSDGLSESAVVWRDIAAILAALGIAAGGMALFATLKAALTSSNIEQMTSALLGSEAYTGMLFFYIVLAPVSAICVLGINLARRNPRQTVGGRPAVLAVVAGLATLAFLAVVATNSAAVGCLRILEGHKEPFELSLWSMWWTGRDNLETCFAYYSTLDLLIISTSVFISVIGTTRRRRRSRRGVPPKGQRSGAAVTSGTIGATVLVAALICGGSLFATGAPAKAGEAAASPTEVDGTVDGMANMPGPTIVLGFRTDVPPFSFLPKGGASSSHPYVGYVAELCYEIFQHSPWTIKQVPINDSTQRFSSIRKKGPDTLDQKADESQLIDVLCDATTLSIGDDVRMEAGIFSPIIFASGVSYLHRPSTLYTDKPTQIGYLESSTALRVAQEICSADVLKAGRVGQRARCRRGAPPECPDKVSGLSQEDYGETSDDGQARSLRALSELSAPYVLCALRSHDALIKWFCQGSDRDKIYVGDREIIQAKEAEWRAQGHDCSDVRPAGKTFTYEPYALLVSKSNPDLVAFVQRRVYELFSHRSGATALFEKWFPNQTISQPVAWLFLLNGVEDEDEALSGVKGFPSIDEPTQVLCPGPLPQDSTFGPRNTCSDPWAEGRAFPDVLQPRDGAGAPGDPPAPL